MSTKPARDNVSHATSEITEQKQTVSRMCGGCGEDNDRLPYRYCSACHALANKQYRARRRREERRIHAQLNSTRAVLARMKQKQSHKGRIHNDKGQSPP
ncbi:MAG TPA: hypothetical protein VHW02_07795 [Rhizomicrobium sp.]|jgi:hypothetical protein|nr:hypothetical protein [Rhizomicrobium sp.]